MEKFVDVFNVGMVKSIVHIFFVEVITFCGSFVKSFVVTNILYVQTLNIGFTVYSRLSGCGSSVLKIYSFF